MGLLILDNANINNITVVEFSKNQHMLYAKDIMDFDEELSRSQERFAPGKLVPEPSLGKISYEKYVDLLLENNWRVFIILLGNKCIGYFHLGTGKYVNSAFLGSFIITKKYRGKGYGKIALNLFKDLIKSDYDIIILYVYNKNIEAKRLYQKVGFEDTTSVMTMKLNKK